MTGPIRIFAPLAAACALLLPLAAFAPAPVRAQDAAGPAASAVPLEAGERTALRCSAAFALVAQGQAAGEPAMAAYPPMAARGREFFVRSAAQIMDRAGLDRAAVAQLLLGEYEDLARGDMLDAVMPPCLLLLDASGL